MKGDIAIAGFMLTAEEWDAMDARSRAQLIAAASRRDDAWVVAAINGAFDDDSTSGPTKSS